jgi:hypothetical protein
VKAQFPLEGSSLRQLSTVKLLLQTPKPVALADKPKGGLD